MNAPKRILVTGGAGFIASHVADRLVATGHEVTVVDNLSTGQQEYVPAAARFYLYDIKSPEPTPTAPPRTSLARPTPRKEGFQRCHLSHSIAPPC